MSRREWIIIAIIIVGAASVVVFHGTKDSHRLGSMEHGRILSTQNQAMYSLDVLSGKSYQPHIPTVLHFVIQDQNGRTLKDFATVHEKKLHLIVVRKDRTNFQHVHPILDAKTGTFTLDSFSFPTSGEYRIFADSTPSNTQKGAADMMPAIVTYQDVHVGDVSNYAPESLGQDKLTSSVDGFDTKLSVAANSPTTSFTANATTNVSVAFNKEGNPYKNLQKYLGALGHMVVLGPNLEYIHAHALSEDTANQTGIVTFAVNFKNAGQYKVYLQTQADNRVTTTDYTLTAQPNLNSNSSSNRQSIQGMDHMSH